MERFDYIIVGGGSAGCVLASRLSADRTARVLLIEAGGSDAHALYRWPAASARARRRRGAWGWHTVPQRQLKQRVMPYTQARVLGGGSSINNQLYTRGVAADYDAWQRDAGAWGWAFRDVLPYFRRSEDNQRFANHWHDAGGPLAVRHPVDPPLLCEAFIQAGQQLGIPFNPDFNGISCEGTGYYQLTQRDARRASAATAFLHPLLQRPNLVHRLHARVLRIVLEGPRAVGVDVAGFGNRTAVALRATREVIVCAGAIGSPRLLMLSGIGPAEHLEAVGVPVLHDLPGVGGNLQDHLDLFAVAECQDGSGYDRSLRLPGSAAARLQYLLFRRGPMASSLFESGAFWYSDDRRRAAAPDLQLQLGLSAAIEDGVDGPRGAAITLHSSVLRPLSRGTVRLASADPAAPPLIDPNYWEAPEDRERALRGLRLAREILRQPALKQHLRGERLPGRHLESDLALADYAAAYARSEHHPVGTCRMGPVAHPYSVVTHELRVIGVDGLRVADASVMPLLPSCCTNAPTLMVAEKAADHVLGLV